MDSTDDPAPAPATPPAEEARVLATLRESPPAVKALLLGILVNRLGAFLGVFLVLYLTGRGFSAVQAGAALSIFTAGFVGGTVLGGALTDRLGPRRTILGSMLGEAVLVLSILVARPYPVLLVAVLAVGVATGLYRPAASSLLSELTPRHRQVMIFAIYRLAYNLGNTVAPLVGVALVAVSYELLFWGQALAAVAYASIAAAALPRRVEPPADEPATAETTTGYRAVLADRRYLLFLLAILINAVVYVQYLGALPLAMRDAGLSTAWYGSVVALNGVIVIGFELLATKVTQRWPMRVVIATGFVLLGLGMSAYGLPFGAAVFVVGTLVWSLAEIVAGPTIFAYPAVAGPRRLRGRYIGAATATFGIGSTCGAVVGLSAWSAAGTGVWWLCGAMCFVGLVAAWVGMRPTPEEAAPAGAEGSEQVGEAGQVGQVGAEERTGQG